MKYTEEQIEEFKKKADKWDALEKKISSFYPDEDSENTIGDLLDIGEAAAIAFGFF